MLRSSILCSRHHFSIQTERCFRIECARSMTSIELAVMPRHRVRRPKLHNVRWKSPQYDATIDAMETERQGTDPTRRSLTNKTVSGYHAHRNDAHGIYLGIGEAGW